MNSSAQAPPSLPRPQQQYSHVPPPQPPSEPQYDLEIVQQPERGKVVVKNKEKDRRPIDPPPIIKVHCRYETGPCSYHHNPYLFCYVSLYDEAEDHVKPQEPQGLPVLVGYTSSSMHRLKDLANAEGAFFVFGDLAATVTGKARLHFTLLEVKPNQHCVVLHKTATSTVMDVQSARDWEGTKESTMLSRSFSEQGVKLRLRKESRASQRRSIIPNAAHHMPPLQAPGYGHAPAPRALPPIQGFDDDGTSEERDAKRIKTYSSASMTPGSLTPGIPTTSSLGYHPQHYGQPLAPSAHAQAGYAYGGGGHPGYTNLPLAQGYPAYATSSPGYPPPQSQYYSPNYGRSMGYPPPQSQGTPPQQQPHQPPPQQPQQGGSAQQQQSGYPSRGYGQNYY